MDWRTACREAVSWPVLDYLRFVEQLPELSVTDAALLVAELDCEVDGMAGWMRDCAPRLVPASHWRTLLGPYEGDDSDDLWRRDSVVQALGPYLAGGLVAELATRPALALRMLASLWWQEPRSQPAIEAAWSQIIPLARHENLAVRIAAAELATRGRQITPAVIAALGEALESISSDDGGNYDIQVEVEELLDVIARMGPTLGILGSHVAPLLESPVAAWRVAAMQAAFAIGDRERRPSIERNEQQVEDGEFGIEIERAMARYAIWQLGGEHAWLDRAIDDATPSIVSVMRLARAFALSPVDERLLEALASITSREAWANTAFSTLGSFGARAASTLAKLAEPATADTWPYYAEARWRTGLDPAARFAELLEDVLASSWHAWLPYVACDAGSTRWHQTIAAAINGVPPSASSGLADGIMGAPAVSVRFLPELVRAGHKDLVTFLWRVLPSDRFWSAVSS